MNLNDFEINEEYLKNCFETLRKNKTLISLLQFSDLVGKYEEKYFKFNEDIVNKTHVLNIFNIFYNNLFIASGNYIYLGDYKTAANFFKRFESVMLFAEINKLKKFLSIFDYKYNLSFLLYHTNEDFEALNRCDSITSEYFIKEMRDRNYSKIISEEETHKKDLSDYSIYFQYMIIFSKLGQLICSKVYAIDSIGKFYFRQKYFEEKLFLKGVGIPYVYQMVTERLNVSIGGGLSIHVVLEEEHGKNGFKKFKIIVRRYLKGLMYKFLRYTTGYGEKPFRLLAVSIFLIIIFGIYYYLADQSSTLNYLEYFYNSLFIFTSFGINDPNFELTKYNNFLISLEIFLGILLIDGFLILLTRKLLR